jgi:hypothetical protein
MGYSYQDLDSRLGVAERKLAFIMEVIKALKVEDGVQYQVTLEQLYRDITTGAGYIVNEPKDSTNGTDPVASAPDAI